MQDIPKTFESEDTIYHYCDLNTAIEFILHNKQLRLSSRKNAVDPIESILPWFSYSRSGDWDEKFEGTSSEATEISKRTLEKIGYAKQLSFCMNMPKNKFPGVIVLPEEYYGFLKPRMWDQYADNYKGVCLAFSLKALKKKGKLFINNPVTYNRYSRLKVNHYSINENKIEKMGIEKYWEEFSAKVEATMFRKHLDYATENEYKFVSFSENEFDYIDIRGCLKGIIASRPFTSEFMETVLRKYSNKFKIDLLYLKWASNGISYTTEKERVAQMKALMGLIASFKVANK